VLSADFERDRTVVVSGPEEGVRVSTDNGTNWAECNAGLADVAVHDLVSVAGGIWAATGDGVYVSRDHTNTWHRSAAGAGAARIVAAASSTVVASFDGGQLVVSADEGTTWRDLHLPVEHSDIAALAVACDGTVLVASITGVELTLWRWEKQRGASRMLVQPSAGVTSVALVVLATEPVDRGVLVGQGGCVLRPLPHAHEVRQHERRPLWRSVAVGPGVVNVTSLAVSPIDRTVFAATNAGVFVSRDAGETFANWSHGLTNPRTVAISVSPNYGEDRLVYALGLGGTVWRRGSA
jgi:hypothetical protein